MFRVPDDMPIASRLAVLERIVSRGLERDDVRAWCVRAAGGRRGILAAERALAAVQALPYQPDPPGEWFEGLDETIARGGDCEDKAALYAACLVVLGMPVRFVWMMPTEDQPDLAHVTCELGVGGSWAWADPTVPGAKLGEEPHAAATRTQWHAAFRRS